MQGKCFAFYFYYYFYKEGKEKINSALSQSPDHINSCDHVSLGNLTGSQYSTVCVLFLHALPDRPSRSYIPVTGQLSEYLSITFCPYVSFKEILSQSCSRRERGRTEKEEVLSFFPQRTHQKVTSLTDNAQLSFPL